MRRSITVDEQNLLTFELFCCWFSVLSDILWVLNFKGKKKSKIISIEFLDSFIIYRRRKMTYARGKMIYHKKEQNQYWIC